MTFQAARYWARGWNLEMAAPDTRTPSAEQATPTKPEDKDREGTDFWDYFKKNLKFVYLCSCDIIIFLRVKESDYLYLPFADLGINILLF